ncbi:MAG: membrane-bound PQQ-dependent dehydrogenase, glucose/quinate/shikimate family [Cellvibrionaceae bacterium]
MAKHSVGVSVRLFSILLIAISAIFFLGGFQLFQAGGSPLYYIIAGALLLASAVLLWIGKPSGSWLYGLVVIISFGWGIATVGLNPWGLLPWVATWVALGLWLLTPWVRRSLYDGYAPSLFNSPITKIISVVGLVVVGIIFIVGTDFSVEELPANRSTNNNANTQTDWPSYGNTAAGTRYSPVDQININNVDQLEEVWRFRTKVGGVAKGTPTQIGDLLYSCHGGNIIIAQDAETGSEVWRHDPGVDESTTTRLRYFTTTCRGVSYYEAPADYDGECKTRLLTGTADARLIAVDSLTGKSCQNFGNNGSVNLLKDLGEVKDLFYFVTSPPAIVKGNAVLGGWVMDNREIKEPSGVVRAFNAITGEFSWAWDMGRPGVSSEPDEGETYTRGSPNVWSLFSVDEERGMVFAPTGNETPDYFGALRNPSSEKFSSSIVALDGATGNLMWSFQTVHHDIWDYDVPSQPTLLDVPDENGKLIPAVLQATKRGEIFMLNRLTGEPIAEVVEKAVSQDAVPEEWTSPTQPFSVGLPNFREPELTENDMWGITPFDQLWCRITFKNTRYEGHFTPPTTEFTLQYPGNAGGFNWGSISVDEEKHLLIANPMVIANRTRLIPRAEMDAGARGSQQAGTPYGFSTKAFLSPIGVPCQKPPYSVLAVIDLQTKKLLWKRPLGTTNKMGPFGIPVKIPLTMGIPLSGGAVTTKGGLIFVAGTMDGFIRAFDVNNGEELWRRTLPQTAQSTPMSYLSPKTKQQMIVVAVPAFGRDYGGARAETPEDEDPEGGYIIAYRLKK